MGIFDKIKEPIFLKESNSLQFRMERLQELYKTSLPNTASRIQQDIRLVQAGITGESNIAFELKNSHMPMIVLHDLYLERGDLSAQIDYLIITRKRHFIVECKNLVGNIQVTNTGDFVRTIGDKKEGIYSPITQNQRHLDLLKQIRKDTKSNILSQGLFEKYFYDAYRSVVVLANPKSMLNIKYAPKDLKQQIIKADQLIAYIKTINDDPGMEPSSEKAMEEMAQFFLDQHKENQIDYTAKYVIVEATEDEKKCPKCGAPMVLRTAKKGINAGNEFWGCARWPKCSK